MLVLLILVFILFAHWFACGWYSIGLSEIQSGLSYGWLTILSNTTGDIFYFSNSTNVNPDVFGGPGKGMRYLTSLYFTLSCMTGVGFGNVAANTEHEKLFSIFMMIIGGKLSRSHSRHSLSKTIPINQLELYFIFLYFQLFFMHSSSPM